MPKRLALHTKALYNSLRLHYLADPTTLCQKWQIEDLRQKEVEELLKSLSDLGVPLKKESFLSFAETAENPEDLAEIIFSDQGDAKKFDQMFLLIFELWRRLIQDKQPISIFCDELDHRIFLYESGELKSDESIQDALANLEEILDENTDKGSDPKEVFQSLSEYIAHDLEKFLYDYISEQIDAGNELYASELLEGFYPYLSATMWFDLLQASLLVEKDPTRATHIFSSIVQRLKKDPDLELQLEALWTLSRLGDVNFFLDLMRGTLVLLQKEEDFQEILEIASHFYQRLDIEELDRAIQTLISGRKEKNLADQLSKKDPDVVDFSRLILP